jgi:hypothetical protein
VKFVAEIETRIATLAEAHKLLREAVVRLRRDIAGASVAERIEAYLAASK